MRRRWTWRWSTTSSTNWDPAEEGDAGCGAGRMITLLDSIAGFDIEGADVSPRMVELARKAHPTRTFTVSDLRALPYEDSRFDGVCWRGTPSFTRRRSLTAHLHDEIAVQGALEAAGFTVRAQLRRGPRATETHDQAFVLARRRA